MRQRLDEIRAQIASACARVKRDSSSVRLLAVSKTQPLELIEEAYDLGLRDFGENYVQELVGKREKLAHLPNINWHLIGPLQTNKARLAVANAEVFHALDSAKLTQMLGRRAQEIGLGAPWPVFIQVNVDVEASKAGVSPNDLPALITAVRDEPALKLEGLMCIPEPKSDIEQMRPAFKRLVDLARQHGLTDSKFSMGMSEDFTVAIEEGAHLIRVGRRLFGPRVQ